MVREFVIHTVLRPLTSALGFPDADLRATLAASQLVGLIMVRHAAELPPLATVPAPAVMRLVGPTVQRYLTGGLPD